MSKPADSASGRGKPGRRLAAVSVVAALVAGAGLFWQLPRASAAMGPGQVELLPADLPPTATAQGPRASGTYQLRCWQYGRLLFDEGPVTLGSETRQAARLVAIDRHGAALIVTDTGGTTCLARPSVPPPNLALPR